MNRIQVDYSYCRGDRWRIVVLAIAFGIAFAVIPTAFIIFLSVVGGYVATLVVFILFPPDTRRGRIVLPLSATLVISAIVASALHTTYLRHRAITGSVGQYEFYFDHETLETWKAIPGTFQGEQCKYIEGYLKHDVQRLFEYIAFIALLLTPLIVECLNARFHWRVPIHKMFQEHRRICRRRGILCPECAYNMQGSITDVCPECGSPTPPRPRTAPESPAGMAESRR